jgi:hypothetical protein
MKEIVIKTLVDITGTKQYRKEQGKEIEYQQQQNLSMLMQTASMRANPVNIKQPTTELVKVDGNFGTNHTGKHQVWTFKFDIEYDGAYTDGNGDDAGLLLDDLNFIPVTVGLDETADISPAMFNTRHDSDCNTIISVVSG